MNDRIDQLRAEYRDLQSRMQDPAMHADPSELARLGKRFSRLESILSAADEREACLRSIEAAAEIRDPELLGLAEEEAARARARLPELDSVIEEFFVPRDPDDDRNVVLEVRAGTGGGEAALFAADLLRMYLRFAEARGWTAEIIDTSPTEGGGLREASCRIAGEGVYGELKFESGVHRVQRVPATESKGRIHTSTATVAILPEAEEMDLKIRPEDLRIDTFRSGGAGGQHVNKTESAVRVTHVPSGLVVSCQSERSQMKNRALAMSLLRSRLYAHEREKADREVGHLRSAQVGSADRSEKIRTYNFPQDRVTDHRLEESFRNLPGLLDGGLGDVVASLKIMYHNKKLMEKRKFE